jgi:hypothetical protein
MSAAFNPFERHVGKPEPAQAQPNAESTGEQPTDSKPATEPDSAPEDQSSRATPVPPRAMRDSKAVNPFASYTAESKNRLELERWKSPPPAAELLVWIRQRWNKPTISLRDIQTYAPRAIRDRMTATNHAETLEKHGWLAPMKMHRRDRLVWRTPPAGATTLPEG